jgi:hypothetical protein
VKASDGGQPIKSSRPASVGCQQTMNLQLGRRHLGHDQVATFL